MSKCISCRYFKQTGPVEFLVSGYCNWSTPTRMPHWLKNFVESGDTMYGPKKQVGKGPYAVSQCDAHEETDDLVVRKRVSETWYE